MNGNNVSFKWRLLNAALRFCALIVCVASLLPSDISAQVGTPKKEKQVTETRDTFDSGNVAIQAIRFERPGAANQPAVVMIPGCDGWTQLAAYRRVAATLVEHGYVVILIRYHDRTQTPDQVSPAARDAFVRWLEGKAAGEKQNTPREHFEKWIATVGDAVAYARRLPNVDKDRVGLLGFSLGGYLAVSAAAHKDLKLNAVVEMFGGLPEEMRPKLKTMPPTLILHGEEDAAVSVKEAYALAGLLNQKKQAMEIEVYAGVGHAFIPPGGTEPNMLVVWNAMNRTMGFLDKHLKADTKTALAIAGGSD
jgi:carboxymethylenebutenolidase